MPRACESCQDPRGQYRRCTKQWLCFTCSINDDNRLICRLTVCSKYGFEVGELIDYYKKGLIEMISIPNKNTATGLPLARLYWEWEIKMLAEEVFGKQETDDRILAWEIRKLDDFEDENEV